VGNRDNLKGAYIIRVTITILGRKSIVMMMMMMMIDDDGNVGAQK